MELLFLSTYIEISKFVLNSYVSVLDLSLTRRDAFDAKQTELLSQINSLRRKLAQKDNKAPHPSSSHV